MGKPNKNRNSGGGMSVIIMAVVGLVVSGLLAA